MISIKYDLFLNDEDSVKFNDSYLSLNICSDYHKFVDSYGDPSSKNRSIIFENIDIESFETDNNIIDDEYIYKYYNDDYEKIIEKLKEKAIDN